MTDAPHQEDRAAAALDGGLVTGSRRRHFAVRLDSGEALECVLLRSGQEPVVVNLDIEPAEPPEEVYWTDDLHKLPPA